jgi:hypothetical protein
MIENLPSCARFFKDAKPKTMCELPYPQGKEEGIAFYLTRDHRIRANFLYAQGVENFAQYAGELPASLTFNSTGVLCSV